MLKHDGKLPLNALKYVIQKKNVKAVIGLCTGKNTIKCFANEDMTELNVIHKLINLN